MLFDVTGICDAFQTTGISYAFETTDSRILSGLFVIIMYVHLVSQVFVKATAQRYEKAAHLLLVALVYLISHTDKKREPLPKKIVQILIKEETDKMCDEWTPESLVPALMKYTNAHSSVRKVGQSQLTPQMFAAGPHSVINGKSAVNFASANYLGLLGHEKLVDSCTSAVEKYGAGSCGPRGFYGTLDVHLDCEARIARFMGTSDSILYPYGLATMFSILPFHCSKTNIIVVDEGVHWGIQNGLLLTRKKTIVYFKHNDITIYLNVSELRSVSLLSRQCIRIQVKLLHWMK